MAMNVFEACVHHRRRCQALRPMDSADWRWLNSSWRTAMHSFYKIILSSQNPGHFIVCVLLGSHVDRCRARITRDAMWKGISVSVYKQRRSFQYSFIKLFIGVMWLVTHGCANMHWQHRWCAKGRCVKQRLGLLVSHNSSSSVKSNLFRCHCRHDIHRNCQCCLSRRNISILCEGSAGIIINSNNRYSRSIPNHTTTYARWYATSSPVVLGCKVFYSFSF